MLKLNASYSKKVPAEGEYSSQSYHASIEVELPDGLSQEQLNEKIHATFAMVCESVEAELGENNARKSGDSVPNVVPKNAPQGNQAGDHVLLEKFQRERSTEGNVSLVMSCRNFPRTFRKTDASHAGEGGVSYICASENRVSGAESVSRTLQKSGFSSIIVKRRSRQRVAPGEEKTYEAYSMDRSLSAVQGGAVFEKEIRALPRAGTRHLPDLRARFL